VDSFLGKFGFEKKLIWLFENALDSTVWKLGSELIETYG